MATAVNAPVKVSPRNVDVLQKEYESSSALRGSCRLKARTSTAGLPPFHRRGCLHREAESRCIDRWDTSATSAFWSWSERLLRQPYARLAPLQSHPRSRRSYVGELE